MEFPSNSDSQKASIKKEVSIKKKGAPKKVEKKVEKVISGEVIQKKKPMTRRLKDTLFGEEMAAAARYVASDVLIPAIRNLIVDSTTKGIERVIYGDNSPQRRNSAQGQSRFSYNTPVNRRANLPDQPTRQPAGRRRHNVDDIFVASRTDGDVILETLSDIIDQYDFASAADLYEMVGLPSNYVDNQWGWTSISSAAVRQVREGFYLDMPPIEPIN